MENISKKIKIGNEVIILVNGSYQGTNYSKDEIWLVESIDCGVVLTATRNGKKAKLAYKADNLYPVECKLYEELYNYEIY